MFTHIVARKANDLIAISCHGGERKMGLGPSAKNFCNHAVSMLGKCHFLLEKGHFRSFAENGSGLDPQDHSLSCASGYGCNNRVECLFAVL